MKKILIALFVVALLCGCGPKGRYFVSKDSDNKPLMQWDMVDESMCPRFRFFLKPVLFLPDMLSNSSCSTVSFSEYLPYKLSMVNKDNSHATMEFANLKDCTYIETNFQQSRDITILKNCHMK